MFFGFQKLLDTHKAEFENAVDFFKNEVSSLRTGRASIAMVENIKVEAYNSMFSLKELAGLSIPEPRSIVIQPWDKSIIGAIEKAFEKSDLGLRPSVDASGALRITISALTDERRAALQKVLHEKAEQARIKIRRSRDAVWDRVQKDVKTGVLREDEKFKAKDELQKVVDGYNKRIQEIVEQKEKELAF